MTEKRSRQFAVFAFLPVVLFGAAMIVDALAREQGDPDRLPVVSVLVVAAILVWLSGTAWAAQFLSSNRDLPPDERRRWLGSLLFFPVALPAIWWNFFRPDHEPRSSKAVANRALVTWFVGVPAFVMIVVVGLLIYEVASR